jgi:hypothetical protein
MIRPASTQLYKNLAANRRLLTSGEDLAPEVLREMLVNALEACEVLSLALDECQRTLESVIESRLTPPGPGPR